MLSDLDLLLRERAIDALLVPMHEAMHPSFRWLTRGAKVTRGYAVKLAGHDPILISYPMERDEAAATGLATRLIHDFGYDAIFKAAPNAVDAYTAFFDAVLHDLGAQPSIAIAGALPFPLYLGIAEGLETRGWKVWRGGDDLVQLARKRKEPWEIEAIRSVGERTEQVVDRVREVLRNASIFDGNLIHEGNQLTLGILKKLVSREISARGMVEDHDTILSQGRDAGIPHSRGDADAVVRASVPIVIDIFPADRATGYFFDLTRTFCVGPIPSELQQIHADVLEAFELARDEMHAGTLASSYQALTCDFFEKRGYATTRSNPATLEGYVHSLGHGVGLDVHEKPFFGLSSSNRDEIEVGDIVTIEPGLYFPDREIGVRIEDTLVVGEDGRVETLCRSDRGLVP
ncbi:MAG: Xaa-Pro aminopeptidase [Thermoanaerobaculia bacterium]|jgi:Xaa-Pro aminopeptidase|nr:Xaa-Pro aminopeptidase [Thermoanaerobaculia bacterium]